MHGGHSRGLLQGPLCCSLLPQAPLAGSVPLSPPLLPPGFLGPSWGGGLGRILHTLSSMPSFLTPHLCFLPGSSQSEVSGFLHSPLCPLRCCLRCHTMSPMSRRLSPRPPRIPRVGARVSSPGPSTELPTMEIGITEGPTPPLTVPFWLTRPSVLLRSVCFSLTLSNPSPAVVPSSPVSGKQKRKASVWKRGI